MLGGLLKAAKFLVGGKYHWRALPTAFVGYNLLKPKPRMDPAYQQMMMYQGMGGPMNPGMMSPQMMNPAMMNPGMYRGY